MNRRDFIKTCAAGAAMATVLPIMAQDAKPQLPDYKQFLPLRSRVTIPDWAKKEIATTLARYKEWKGDDMTVAFPLVTDVHCRPHTLPADLSSFADPKMHILFAQMAGEEANADFVADLGDMDLDFAFEVAENGAKKIRPYKPEEFMSRAAVEQAHYAESKLPVLFAVGNHDHALNRFTSEQFGKAFNVTVNNGKGFNLTLCPTGDYGYYDIPNKNVRAIFLNTSDEGYYGYSIAQLNFFVNALTTLPENGTAVIMQHFCIQHEIGHWATSIPHARAKRQDIVIRIMEDCIARRRGELEGVKWDFSNGGKRYIAGCLAGDSHIDNYLKCNGIDYIISQGYGPMAPFNVIPGAHLTSFDSSKQMLIDFVAIKPAKHEVKIFR
ncbi:MAG: twin-arginine translocation signal domain-containing protein, partial [Victivallales bacterium]|nr:twin-arginine translocation signal domain-containing protein [Victivallales bacterium]